MIRDKTDKKDKGDKIVHPYSHQRISNEKTIKQQKMTSKNNCNVKEV